MWWFVQIKFLDSHIYCLVCCTRSSSTRLCNFLGQWWAPHIFNTSSNLNSKNSVLFFPYFLLVWLFVSRFTWVLKLLKSFGSILPFFFFCHLSWSFFIYFISNFTPKSWCFSLTGCSVIVQAARNNVLLAVPALLYAINNYLKFIMQVIFSLVPLMKPWAFVIIYLLPFWMIWPRIVWTCLIIDTDTVCSYTSTLQLWKCWVTWRYFLSDSPKI